MTAPEAFEKWWQALPLRNGEITADHIRQAWDAGLTFEQGENSRIAVAYSAIEELWGDSMTWEQIETLARRVVRALDVHRIT